MSAPAAGGGDQDGELAAWASGHAATVGRPAPARQAGAEIAAAEELEPRLLSVLQGKGNRPEGGATRSGEDRQGVRGLALARVDDGGFLLATGSHDGTVKVFDPITGALLQTITDHTDTVRGVALHALRDGSVLLATCSEDGTVRVWDPVEARCLQVLEDTGGCSDAAAFIELDGELLLVTGDRDGARIRDPHTGETLRMLEGHRQKVYCLAVTVLPDGTALLATGSNDSNVRVWDLRTGACVHVLEGYSAEIHTVRFGTLPDGTTFVFCDGMGSRLIAWDVGTGAQLYSTVHDAGVVEASSFLLQPDGSIVLLLTDSSARGVRLWDPVRGQPVRQLLTVDDPPWSMLLFTAPDGRLFMAARHEHG
nr:hypothetical protein GCM10020092_089660 [Actinoplanes digitatis]